MELTFCATGFESHWKRYISWKTQCPNRLGVAKNHNTDIFSKTKKVNKSAWVCRVNGKRALNVILDFGYKIDFLEWRGEGNGREVGAKGGNNSRR